MSGIRGGLGRLCLGKLTITPPAFTVTKPEGSVIILHGSCDTGSGMKIWLDQIKKSEFNFHNYRILYPSSPTLPYSLLNGEKAGVWFDRLSLGPTVPEDLLTIERTANELNELLQEESKNTGIPLNKMVVGGFSMGGIMALHLGYRFQTQMAGVFALSSFLPLESEVFNNLKERTMERTKIIIDQRKVLEKARKSHCHHDDVVPIHICETKTLTPTVDKILKPIKSEEEIRSPKYPKLFMSQGSRDPLVPYPWARRTFSFLRRYGVEGHFFTHPNGSHSIEPNQLTLLHRWIQEVISSGNNPGTKKKIKKNRRRTWSINDSNCEPVERF